LRLRLELLLEPLLQHLLLELLLLLLELDLLLLDLLLELLLRCRHADRQGQHEQDRKPDVLDHERVSLGFTAPRAAARRRSWLRAGCGPCESGPAGPDPLARHCLGCPALAQISTSAATRGSQPTVIPPISDFTLSTAAADRPSTRADDN
jgi:hypothetical protein